MHYDQDGGIIVPLRTRPVVGGEPFRARDAGDGYEVEKEKGANRWTVFMLPETSAARELVLYEATDWPRGM